MQMVYVPDEIYFMQKRGVSRLLVSLLLVVRKIARVLPETLYTRLLTDHCIALVRSRSS
jgi:hypothetical protein